jgi:hypothetical protein
VARSPKILRNVVADHPAPHRQPSGREGTARKDFSGPLAPIRTLRNRIAHHEPIIEWNLPKHYGKMIDLTGWLCPAAADWCEAHSRFPEVYPPEAITLHQDGDPDGATRR